MKKKKNDSEYLQPSERAALLALPAWTDADLAAVLGVSRDTLRRAIQPDATAARLGALDLRLARVIHLGATRLWDAEDVRRLIVAAGRRAAALSPVSSRTSRAADAVAG